MSIKITDGKAIIGKIPPTPKRWGSNKNTNPDGVVIHIRPDIETDAHGWPTDDAIRQATKVVNGGANG